jgi:hypothetical protein
MYLFKSPMEQIINGSHTNRQVTQHENSLLEQVINLIRTSPNSSHKELIEKIEKLKHPVPSLFPPPNKKQII